MYGGVITTPLRAIYLPYRLPGGLDTTGGCFSGRAKEPRGKEGGGWGVFPQLKPGSKASVKGAPGALLPVRQCGIPRRPLVKSPQLSESGKRKKRLGAKATAREKGGGVWRGWDDSLRSGFGRALPQAYRALSLVPGGGMGSDLEGHALQCTLEGRTDLCARQVHWTDDAKVERKRAALFGITCVAKLYEVGFSLVGLPQLPRRGAGTAADYHNYIIAFERVMKNRGLGK